MPAAPASRVLWHVTRLAASVTLASPTRQEEIMEAIARPAATIMLLRDGPAGIEVFMVVRHHAIDANFAGAGQPFDSAVAQSFQ